LEILKVVILALLSIGYESADSVLHKTGTKKTGRLRPVL
jgi:hypothetical protein